MKKPILAVLALMAGSLPMVAGAQTQVTQIGFLNPSPYVDAQIPELSDEEGRSVHLVAWVAPVPASPGVEFELQPNTASNDGGSSTTIQASRVGEGDTWEARFSIPAAFQEGEYILRARVFSATEVVATTEITVKLDHASPPPELETVDLIRPVNGGAMGFYLPPGKGANSAVRVAASRGTERVRVLYTLTPPGTAPVWTHCGSGVPDPETQIAAV
ncbi:MAG TPA: hypothetical protein VNP73_06760, partial [Actinomycetota bacterium]|nr:hypothetical protein [Actinomycetota bacterium]